MLVKPGRQDQRVMLEILDLPGRLAKQDRQDMVYKA